MNYKTILLEMLQDQPEAYQQLCATRMLHTAMNRYAQELKASHDAWKHRIGQAKPDSDPSQIASEAMELALEELRVNLLCASATGDDPAEPLSLEAAMSFIRSHTPAGS